MEAEKNSIRNAALHHDVSLVLCKMGHLEEAEQHCLKAVEYAPDAKSKANYCGNYAAILRDLKRYDKAEGYFDLALKLNDADIDIHHLSNYADLLREMGKYKESKDYFEIAMNVIEDSKPKRSSIKESIKESLKDRRNNAKNGKNGIPNNQQLVSQTSGSIDLQSLSISNTDTNTSDLDNKSNNQSVKTTKKRSSIFKRNSALNTKLAKIAISESNTFTKKMVGKTYSNYALCLFSMKLYDESNVCYLKAIQMDQDNQVRHYNYARLLYDTQV